MKMITKEAPLEFKAGAEPGSFSGYVSIFDNVDDGNDVIQQGAFKKFREIKKDRVVILRGHDSDKIIGDAAFSQDQKGVLLEGNLYVDDPDLTAARESYALAKRGALNAMSVGFTILEGGAHYEEKTNRRIITKAEFWEGSLVLFGMNRKAKIRSVKSAVEIGTVREFESHLRDIGFSQKDAKAIASHGYGALHRDGGGSGDHRDGDGHSSEMLDALKASIADNPIKFI